MPRAKGAVLATAEHQRLPLVGLERPGTLGMFELSYCGVCFRLCYCGTCFPLRAKASIVATGYTVCHLIELLQRLFPRQGKHDCLSHGGLPASPPGLGRSDRLSCACWHLSPVGQERLSWPPLVTSVSPSFGTSNQLRCVCWELGYYVSYGSSPAPPPPHWVGVTGWAVCSGIEPE